MDGRPGEAPPDPLDGAGDSSAGGLKTFRCGDVVPGCEQAFRGTAADVLREVGDHAARDHGADPADPALLAAVRAAVRPA